TRFSRDWSSDVCSSDLERFAENTLEFMRRERHLLTDAPELPTLRTRLAGRDVMVVVRGHDYQADLAALRAYISEVRPVLIGVDRSEEHTSELQSRENLV